MGQRGAAALFLLPSEMPFLDLLRESQIPLEALELRQLLDSLNKAPTADAARQRAKDKLPGGDFSAPLC